ncbi:MAG: hypothetical protein ACK5LM_04120 [Lactovum sp.]
MSSNTAKKNINPDGTIKLDLQTFSNISGTGKYKDVGGHHTTAQSVFKGNGNYNGREAFSVSIDKLDDINTNLLNSKYSSGTKLHVAITKN